MSRYHKIQNVKFVKDNLMLSIDGKNYSFKLSDISKKLYNTSKSEREKYRVSPSGYGISWLSLDEDLSVDGLLEIEHKPNLKHRKIAS